MPKLSTPYILQPQSKKTAHAHHTQLFFNVITTIKGRSCRRLFMYNVPMLASEYLKTNPRQDPRSKYGNLKTEYNGTIFHSKKEANYAQQLDYMKKATSKADKVIKYDMQVPFQVVMNNIKICRYIADFKVFYANGRIEIVDVKGVRTQMYSLKKKLVEAQYGIKIIEV